MGQGEHACAVRLHNSAAHGGSALATARAAGIAATAVVVSTYIHIEALAVRVELRGLHNDHAWLAGRFVRCAAGSARQRACLRNVPLHNQVRAPLALSAYWKVGRTAAALHAWTRSKRCRWLHGVSSQVRLHQRVPRMLSLLHSVPVAPGVVGARLEPPIESPINSEAHSNVMYTTAGLRGFS